MDIIDLDIALPKDKQIRVDGKVYLLPGDLPVELYLSIQRARKQFAASDPDEMISQIRDDVLKLFQIRDPKIKALPASIGMEQMIGIITKVYGGDVESEERPPRRRRGTPSSKPAATGR